MKKLLFLSVLQIVLNTNSISQFKFVDSCSKFNLLLKIKNPYSDTIVYLYKDCEKGVVIKERTVLVNGETRISGYINRSAEAVIYCNIYSQFEDSSFFRLILEPGEITVTLTMTGANIVKQNTTGSISQNERQRWNNDNELLLQMENDYLAEYRQFLKSNIKLDSAAVQKKQWMYQNKLDVLNELKVRLGLAYIKQHPGSYFSGALLFRFKSRYAVDTIMKYFNILSANVQQSDFGKYILEDVFKRSNDWAFFSDYMDSSFYKKLKNIKSIYDISLTSLNGETVTLSNYKNKILLFDFWSSGCKPCIASIPSINRLMEDFKNYPVEIISVSMDTKESVWKNTVSSNNYKGVHLLDKDGFLATYYKVLWAPKYIIIDNTGAIIDADAPSPREGESLKRKILENVNKRGL